jgi:hypothetical protein
MQHVLNTLWHYVSNVVSLEIAPSTTTHDSLAPFLGSHAEVPPILLAPVEILSLVASLMDRPSPRNMRLASRFFEKAVSTSQSLDNFP